MALDPDSITEGMWVKENRQGAKRRKVTRVRGNMVSTITPYAGGYSGDEEFHASKLVRADADDCLAAMDALVKRVDSYAARRRGDGIESPEFKEGYDAGKSGKEAKDNPYPLSSQKGRDWRSGWAISQVKSK